MLKPHPTTKLNGTKQQTRQQNESNQRNTPPSHPHRVSSKRIKMNETQTPTKEKQSFCSCVHIEQKEMFVCYIYFSDALIEHNQTVPPCWEDESKTAKRAKSAFNVLQLWLIGLQTSGARQQLPFNDKQTTLVNE